MNNEINNPKKDEKGFKIFGFPWELAFLLTSLFAGVILVILKFTGML